MALYTLEDMESARTHLVTIPPAMLYTIMNFITWFFNMIGHNIIKVRMG